MCARHRRWLLDADANQRLEYLDVGGLPEVVAAQRRWVKVARRAVQAGAEPGKVFAVAHAVVARWWEQALQWERETIWPRRLHQVAGGNAGADLDRWRIGGRDAVVFPEVVAVADALLDPAMAELVWIDSGAGRRTRLLSADGVFCRRLGERVDRPWLSPLAAVDYDAALIAWMGSIIRIRHGIGEPPPGRGHDPWWVRQEHQPATMAGQLRVLAKEKRSPGSGTMWRSMVSAERRGVITSLIRDAEDQLTQLRGVQTGPTVDVARQLLSQLSDTAGLIHQALLETAEGAMAGAVRLEDLAQWVRMPVADLAEALTAYRSESSAGYGDVMRDH